MLKKFGHIELNEIWHQNQFHLFLFFFFFSVATKIRGSHYISIGWGCSRRSGLLSLPQFSPLRKGE